MRKRLRYNNITWQLTRIKKNVNTPQRHHGTISHADRMSSATRRARKRKARDFLSLSLQLNDDEKHIHG